MSTKQFSIYPIRTRIMFVSVRKKFVSHSFAFCRIDTCSLSSHHFVNYALASMLGGSLVTTAWQILRLQMERRPPDTEGSCEYTE